MEAKSWLTVADSGMVSYGYGMVSYKSREHLKKRDSPLNRSLIMAKPDQ